MLLPPKLRFLSRPLALLVLAAGTVRSLAEYPLIAPSSELTLPQLKYIDVNVEGQQSTATGGGSQSTYQQLYVATTAGIAWDYYLYHPNLLTYSLLAEPGYIWQMNGGNSTATYGNDLMLNGHFKADLLQYKPYSTVFNYDASHEIEQYDFFNTVVQDVQTYGATTGYREGPVPVTVSVQKTTVDSSEAGSDTTMDQIGVGLHANNARKNGSDTDLLYQYEDYDWNQSGAGGASSSSSQTVTLTDAENWGRYSLNSSLLASESDYSGVTSDNANLTENLSVQHTPNLRSFYDYGLAYYTSDGGDSTQNNARVGLQHQLYESLATTVDVHGSTYDSEYTGASLEDVSGGSTLSLNYSKCLADWAHLSAGNAVSYDYTEQTSSGGVIPVLQEPHVITGITTITGVTNTASTNEIINGVWIPLNQPQDVNDGSFLIVDQNTGATLSEATDYRVNRTVNPWQFEMLTPSLTTKGVPDFKWGDTVLVTYDVQPNPTGGYSTFSDMVQVRLDLWGGLLDLHARYNYTVNEADAPGFVLQNLEQFEGGTDINWKRLRFSADYTDSDSSLFSYYSYMLTESVSLFRNQRSSLSVDFDQNWTYYPADNTGQTEQMTFYNYMLRYTVKPAGSLNWKVEAGYQQQHGGSVDQDQIAARTYLDWMVGKLSVNIGYEYQDEEFIGNSQNRNFVFLRMRRNF